jgi:hypothetical protein
MVVYNGTTSGNTPASMNTILDKLMEMWTFDSTDTESTYHSATYGNAKIKVSNQDGRFGLYNGDTEVSSNIGYYNQNVYTIAKTDNAVMLALGAGSGAWVVWIIGTLTNIDGTTGKGIVGIVADTGAWYAVLGDSTQANVTDTLRTSQDIAQLVPYVSTQGGWYFDNAYRLLIGLNNTLKGKYQIGEDVYYIAGRSAIKE